MPSPLGHALAGLALHAAFARGREDLSDLRRIGIAVGAATAPDIDLLFRFVDGRNHHQMATHGVGFALLAGLAVAGLARWRGWRPLLTLSLLATTAWLSHIGLDLLGLDTHPPIGVMAAWPFAEGYFKAPWTVFMDIGRTLDWETIRHNALAMAWEVVLLAPLLLTAWRFRSVRAER